MMSTKNLEEVPDIDKIQKISKSLAVLSTIFMSNLHCYFEDTNKATARMFNEGGEAYHILFNEFGALIKGVSTESDMLLEDKIWPGIIDDVPKEFEESLKKYQFGSSSTFITFCIWKKYSDTFWNKGNFQYPGNTERDYDGSEYCLSYLFLTPEDYHGWAEEYYYDPDVDDEYHEGDEEYYEWLESSGPGMKIIDIESVKQIYEHKPLTEKIIKSLNSSINSDEIDEIKKKIIDIGYPINF
jgi:hypothetical protein